MGPCGTGDEPASTFLGHDSLLLAGERRVARVQGPLHGSTGSPQQVPWFTRTPRQQLRLAEQRCLAAETPEPAAFFSLDDSDSDSDEDAGRQAERPARASSLPHPATSEHVGAHHRPTISLVDLGLQVCLPLPCLPVLPAVHPAMCRGESNGSLSCRIVSFTSLRLYGSLSGPGVLASPSAYGLATSVLVRPVLLAEGNPACLEKGPANRKGGGGLAGVQHMYLHMQPRVLPVLPVVCTHETWSAHTCRHAKLCHVHDMDSHLQQGGALQDPLVFTPAPRRTSPDRAPSFGTPKGTPRGNGESGLSPATSNSPHIIPVDGSRASIPDFTSFISSPRNLDRGRSDPLRDVNPLPKPPQKGTLLSMSMCGHAGPSRPAPSPGGLRLLLLGS